MGNRGINETERNRKICNKDKIGIKLSHEDPNGITTYASSFFPHLKFLNNPFFLGTTVEVLALMLNVESAPGVPGLGVWATATAMAGEVVVDSDH